jgi:hypothetical protein
VAIVAYHSNSSDPFYQYDARMRAFNYYVVGYYPTAIFDGGDDWVVGGGVNAINDYLVRYDQCMSMNTPGVLSIKVDYDPITLTGKIISRFTLVDQLRDADLHLRYALTESHIHHEWAYLDSLHFVVRDMPPGYDGVTFSISPGETLVDSQSFFVDPGWVDHHFELAAFVQDDRTGNVLVSNWVPLYQTHISGDANGDGAVTVSDVVYLTNYILYSGPGPEPSAAGDPTEDCIIDSQDVVYVYNYLFHQGPAPLRGWEID